MKLTRIVHLLLIIFVSLGLLLFPGCAKEEEQTKKVSEKESLSTTFVQRGGTYRFPLLNNPTTLDPAYVRDQYGETLVHQLFDGLVRFDPYLAVLPALAETWKVEDNGKTYRFVLRENAQFHNGRSVTTDDVVFSINRLIRVESPPAILPHLLKIDGAQEYRNNATNRINGLERIDDRILRIRLEEPHAPFLTALGMVYAKIVPKKEIVQLGKQFWENPVGSGPFRFVSWETNKSIQLERFSDYYAGASFLDAIQYTIYPGGKTEKALADFREGKLEEMPVYGKIRQELSAQSGLQWFHRPSLSLFFYGINCRHPLLKDSDLREALSMAIDRQKLVDRVYASQFEIAKAILPPGMPGYQPSNQPVIYNISKAREHLKRTLGKKVDNIPPIEIVSAIQTPLVQSELDLIREAWTELGIKLKIKYITDWKTYEEYLKSGSLQIYRYAWFADMPDPDSIMQPLFASDSPVNYMRFNNKEVDKMLQTARGIIDPNERAKMYQQIEKIIIESSPLIRLFYLSVDRVYQPAVQDIQVSALGAHTIPLNRIWLKKSSTQQ